MSLAQAKGVRAQGVSINAVAKTDARSLLRKRSLFSGFWQPKSLQGIDRVLLLAVLALVSIGLLIVMSASISYADKELGDGLFFTKRHVAFLFVSGLVSVLALQVPTQWWCKNAGFLIFVGVLILILVLIPGVGHKVNNSRRWFKLGFLTLQASEPAKLAMIIFIAAYLQRHQLSLKDDWGLTAVPIVVLGVFLALLVKEPDIGSAVMIAGTVLSMLFLGGARMRYIFGLLAVGGFSLWWKVYYDGYHWERIVAFQDPWAAQFGDGYQLVQSLIAFGRGEWFGVGLGNSVQKLFFLPEAHTDFVLAIFAEEFGLLGVLIVMGLFTLAITRMFMIARKAVRRQQWFAAHLVFGIGVLLAGQVFVNVGVTSGLLPTKGLTLPFISYGGSSLLVCSVMTALVLRVGLEMSDVALPAKSAGRRTDIEG